MDKNGHFRPTAPEARKNGRCRCRLTAPSAFRVELDENQQIRACDSCRSCW